jgi:hypothetical protein
MGINEKDKKTCTTIFLLPAIGLYRKDILKYGFLSAYLKDKHREISYDKAIYLLYKPPAMEKFQEFLRKEYSRTPLLIEDYDYAGGYVVTVYQFPEEFLEEYRLFLQGKYSKFRRQYRKLFPDYIVTGEGEREVSLQYHIFNKTSAIRDYWETKVGTALDEDAEMWSKPDIESEKLDITQLPI